MKWLVKSLWAAPEWIGGSGGGRPHDARPAVMDLADLLGYIAVSDANSQSGRIDKPESSVDETK